MRLEFELRLKDLLSGMLPKVQNTARTVFSGVDEIVNRTKKNLNDLGSKEYKLKVDTSDIKRAGQEIENLNSKIQRGGAWDMFKGSFFGGLASRGVERGASALRDVGGQALNAGMDAEQQIIGLKTFVGEARAKSLYAELQKASALTPFTTADIMPQIMTLIASGQNEERAKKDVWNLMNALSATGNAGNAFMLQLMGTHLASAAAQGHLDGRIMMEFQRTAHIPIQRLIANDMFPNLTPKQGMKKVDAMDVITYDQLTSALDRAGKAGGMFAGALEAQSQTIRGKASTIKDWWNIGLAKSVLDPTTHDNITRLEDRIISGLQDFPELIGKMSPVINKLFDEFNDLWPNIKDFGGALLDMLKPIGSLFLSDEFKGMGKSFMELGKELAEDLTPIVKELAQGLKGIAYLLTPSNMYSKKPGADVQSYVFSDTTGFGAKGLLVDVARKNAIRDSLTAGGLLGGKGMVFDSYRDFLNYQSSHADVMGNRSGSAVSIGLPGMPGAAAPGATGKKTGMASGVDDASDSILGGGQKVVTINMNAPLYRVDKQIFNGLKEYIDDLEPRVQEAMWKILRLVPA